MNRKISNEEKTILKKLLNQRKWTSKSWARATGVNQKALEGLLNGQLELNEEMINYIIKLSKESTLPNLLTFNKPITIATYTHKGGTGKTTFDTNFAFELATRGYNVLVLDFDGQADATSTLYPQYLHNPELNIYNCIINQDDVNKYVVQTEFDNLYCVPGSVKCEELPIFLDKLSSEDKHTLWDRCFQQLYQENFYDFIIIDMDKTIQLHSQMILSYTDFIIPVVEPTMYPLKSLITVLGRIDIINQTYAFNKEPNLELLGIIINKIDNRKDNSEEIEQIIELAPQNTFIAKFNIASVFEKAQKENTFIGVIKKSSRANKQLVEVTDKLTQIIKKSKRNRD